MTKEKLTWVVLAAIVCIAATGAVVILIAGNNRAALPQKLTIDDIQELSIHSGVDVGCPAIAGVSDHGYIYTVLLTNNRGVIERAGCGAGEPETFAAAIAQDLEAQGVFRSINTELLLERMTFRFYEPR